MTFLFEARDISWHAEAACAAPGVDVTLFFPNTHGRPPAEYRPEIKVAKAICAGCPVKDVCLADAIERKERWGIWGGMTETERKTLFAEQEHRKHTPGPALSSYCGRGHDLRREENVIQLPDGTRRCRTCKTRADKGQHTREMRQRASA